MPKLNGPCTWVMVKGNTMFRHMPFCHSRFAICQFAIVDLPYADSPYISKFVICRFAIWADSPFDERARSCSHRTRGHTTRTRALIVWRTGSCGESAYGKLAHMANRHMAKRHMAKQRSIMVKRFWFYPWKSPQSNFWPCGNWHKKIIL